MYLWHPMVRFVCCVQVYILSMVTLAHSWTLTKLQRRLNTRCRHQRICSMYKPHDRGPGLATVRRVPMREGGGASCGEVWADVPNALLPNGKGRDAFYAVEQCTTQQLMLPSHAWHECVEEPATIANTPHPSLLLWLIASIKQTPVLLQLWIQYTKTQYTYGKWLAMLTTTYFCQHVISYFDTMNQTAHDI